MNTFLAVVSPAADSSDQKATALICISGLVIILCLIVISKWGRKP